MLGGMSGNLGIGVSIFLKDQFSGPALNVKRQMQQMQNSLQKVSADTVNQYRNQQLAMAGAGTLVLGSFGKSIEAAGEFSITMEMVRGISKSNSQEFKTLSKTAMELGQATLFSSQDVAEGMEYLARAGMSPTEVNANIKAATYLAAATRHALGGTGGTADLMANIMKTYGIGIQYAEQTADILGKASTIAPMKIDQLGESLEYVGHQAHALNIGLPETAAMLGVLAETGIKGSAAGTALASTLRHLASALGTHGSPKQKEILTALGLSPEDLMTAQGELKSMGEIVKVMWGAAAKKTTVEGQSLLSALFDVRGGKGMNALIQNLDSYQKKLDLINNSVGTNKKLNENILGTLGGQLDVMFESFRTFSIAFGESLKPLLMPLLKGVSFIVGKLADLLATPILGKFLAGGIAGFLAIKTVSFAYRGIVASLRLLYHHNTTAFAQHTARTVAGYNAMRNAAAGYASAAAGPNRTGKYGANWGGYSPGGLGYNWGMASRGVAYNKAGKLVRSRTTGFGRAGGMISNDVLDRYKRMHGVRGVKGMSGVAGPTSGLMTALGGLTGMLGKVAGIFTGPWGMALSFILPGAISSLIDALSSNEDATEEASAITQEESRKRILYRGGTSMSIDEADITGAGQYIFRDYAKQANVDEFIKRNPNANLTNQGGVPVMQGTTPESTINIFLDGNKKVIKQTAAGEVHENMLEMYGL